MTSLTIGDKVSSDELNSNLNTRKQRKGKAYMILDGETIVGTLFKRPDALTLERLVKQTQN